MYIFSNYKMVPDKRIKESKCMNNSRFFSHERREKPSLHLLLIPLNFYRQTWLSILLVILLFQFFQSPGHLIKNPHLLHE
jgi:hypothetical protein